MEARPRIGHEIATRTHALPQPLRGARVALVHDWLTGMRGGEKCLEVLCEAFPNATLHTLLHARGSTSPSIERMAIRTSPLQFVPGVAKRYRHLLPIMPLAARAWNVGKVDLVVSLSHCVAKAVRVPPGIPHVCYCFTPMRYAWDGRDAYLASWGDRPVRRSLAGWSLDRLRGWDRATSSRVTRFVAISRTIQERIARCYGRTSDVIYPPVNTDYFRPEDSREREDFDLCVSALVPYKRIDHAIAACTRLKRTLVVIGAGPDRERLETLAGPTIRFLGWQTDDVIREHLQRCRALLFPGEEDFGIVPIEALACGAPVIALNRGGAAETVDRRVGWTYDDPTPEGLMSALEQWDAHGRPNDAALARSLAERFDTSVFRQRLLALLASTLAGEKADVPPAPHIGMERKPA